MKQRTLATFVKGFRASIISSCNQLNQMLVSQPNLELQALWGLENSNPLRNRIKAEARISPLSSNVLETLMMHSHQLIWIWGAWTSYPGSQNFVHHSLRPLYSWMVEISRKVCPRFSFQTENHSLKVRWIADLEVSSAWTPTDSNSRTKYCCTLRLYGDRSSAWLSLRFL